MYKTVILPVVLCGCETWSPTLREEHRLRGIFWLKGDRRTGVTGGWRKLHNEELHILYCSLLFTLLAWFPVSARIPVLHCLQWLTDCCVFVASDTYLPCRLLVTVSLRDVLQFEYSKATDLRHLVNTDRSSILSNAGRSVPKKKKKVVNGLIISLNKIFVCTLETESGKRQYIYWSIEDSEVVLWFLS
jgi:hypothetical protein